MSARARDPRIRSSHGVPETIPAKVAAAAAEPGAPARDERLVVAVSGGVDSLVLLHCLAFSTGGARERIVAAHFDHRMRPGSAADARWLRGLASAWRVELVTASALTPPRSEAEARTARYAFLEAVRHSYGAARVVTAHHADDQAETVLFRILRGTGPAGLRGIRSGRASGRWRPLLGAWRSEVMDYARSAGIRWREDPTNRTVELARNALRHRVLPEVERIVAAGARDALVRLAETAARDEEGWESLLPGLIDALDPRRTEGGTSIDRAGLRDLHPAVRARVVRALAGEVGVRLSARRTEAAVTFVDGAESGRALELGRGVVLRRDLDRIVVRPAVDRDAPSVPDRIVLIPGPERGAARGVISGRPVRVGWGAVDRCGGHPPPTSAEAARFSLSGLRFPLVVRSWQAGDRMPVAVGTKKLKQVFLEARVPAPERRRIPVLADRDGSVLWIPGVARSSRSRPPRPPGEGLWQVWLAPELPARPAEATADGPGAKTGSSPSSGGEA